MSKCTWNKDGSCTFPLGCGYERDNKCRGFERFDIQWNDIQGMLKASRAIENMIKEYDNGLDKESI